MHDRLRSQFHAAAHDQSGTVAVIFALCIIPVLTLVAGAIDYGRVFKTQATIQNAADAAAYASRGRLLAGETAVAMSMRAHLDANLPEHLKGLPFALKVADDRRSMQVTLDTEVPTTLMAMVGVRAIGLSVTSTASLPKAAPAISSGVPSAAEIGRALETLSPGGATLPPDPRTMHDLLQQMPTPPRLSPADIEQLRNSDEVRRAAAEMEARLRAALEAHGARGAGGMPDLGRLLGQ